MNAECLFIACLDSGIDPADGRLRLVENGNDLVLVVAKARPLLSAHVERAVERTTFNGIARRVDDDFRQLTKRVDI